MKQNGYSGGKYITEVQTNNGKTFFYHTGDDYVINTIDANLEEIRTPPRYKLVVPIFDYYKDKPEYSFVNSSPGTDSIINDTNNTYTDSSINETNYIDVISPILYYTFDMGWFTGIWACCGWFREKSVERKTLCFTLRNTKVINKLKEIILSIDANAVFNTLKNRAIEVTSADNTYNLVASYFNGPSNIPEFINDDIFIYRKSNDSIIQFLHGVISGVLDAQATIYANRYKNKKPVVKLYSINYNFLAKIKQICDSFGYDCNIYFNNKTNSGNVKYYLSFTIDGIYALINNITLVHPDKESERSCMLIPRTALNQNKYYTPQLSTEKLEELLYFIERYIDTEKNNTNESNITYLQTLYNIVKQAKNEEKVLTYATVKQLKKYFENDEFFMKNEFWKTWFNYTFNSGFKFEMITRIKKYFI